MSEIAGVEKAALQALADACDYSLKAHVPIEAITSRFPRYLRGDAKKALKKLRRKGYCRKHPAGRKTTWQLTPNGLNIARAIFET